MNSKVNLLNYLCVFFLIEQSNVKMFQKVGLYLEIIFLVIVYSERCFSEQRFLETPPSYQEVSSGEDVELRCKVSDKKGQCIWQKDRKAVGMHRDKYETAGEQHSDCTLLIRNASLEFDDGLWECQVTAGDFTTQDGLTSLPSRLLVRGTYKNIIEYLFDLFYLFYLFFFLLC